MKYRLLGQTGLYVSEPCLGIVTFGSAGFRQVMSGLVQEVVTTQIRRAFDAGANFIDAGCPSESGYAGLQRPD